MKRICTALAALVLLGVADCAMAAASYYNCKEGAQPIYPYGTTYPYSLITYREWDSQKPGDKTTGGWVDGDTTGNLSKQIGCCWLYADLTKGKDYVITLNESSGLFLQISPEKPMTYSKFSQISSEGLVYGYIRASEWSAFDEGTTFRFYVKVLGSMGSVNKPFTLTFREASIDDLVVPPKGSVKNPIALNVTSGGSQTIVNSFDRPSDWGRLLTAYAVSLTAGHHYVFSATHPDMGVYLSVADWTIFADFDEECTIDLAAGKLTIDPTKNYQAVIYAMPDDAHWENGNVGGGTLTWTVDSDTPPGPVPPDPPDPPEPTSVYWSARNLQVKSFDYAANGTLKSAKLVFGSDNGLTNRLYLAWGAADGGTRIGGWEHTQLVCEVPGTMSEKTVEFPAGVRHARFFLDVPFPAGNSGELLSYVKGDGTHYIDTGVILKGGDDLRARVRPETAVGGSVFGTRGADVNTDDIVMAFDGAKFVLDYCGSGISGDYDNYRLTGKAVTLGTWYDAVLSATERSLGKDGVKIDTDDSKCDHVFQTSTSCHLFHGNNSAVPAAFAGSIASFSIRRGEAYIADYLPYRFGAQYGFFDRVSGTFKTVTGLTGEVDTTSSSPLTSVSELISGIRVDSRTVFITEQSDAEAMLGFSAGNGCVNRLYMGWGAQDGGMSTNGWDHVEYLGEVTDSIGNWRAELPMGAKYVRFFLERPLDSDECVLDFVSGDGTHYIDTGIVLKGGDDVRARVRSDDVKRRGSVFGSRGASVNTDDIVMAFGDSCQFVLDYCGSRIDKDYANYRLMGPVVTQGRWYDAVLSAEVRSLSDESGSVTSNTARCGHEFQTVSGCHLFHAHNSAVSEAFTGSIASFSIRRGGESLADYLPFRRGTEYGFFDRVTGRFKSADGFGGTDHQGAPVPAMTVSALITRSVQPTRAGMYRGEVLEDVYARMSASFDLVVKILADGSTNLTATVSVGGNSYSYQDAGNGEEMVCPVEIGGKTYRSYFTVGLRSESKVAVDGSIYIANDEVFFNGILDGTLIEWEDTFLRADPMTESAADMGITAGAFKNELPRSDALVRLCAWGVKNNVRISSVNAIVFSLAGDPIEQLGTAYLLDCAPTDEAIEAAKAGFVITTFDPATGFVEVGGTFVSGDDFGNGRIEVRSANALDGPYTVGQKTGLAQVFYRAFLVK